MTKRCKVCGREYTGWRCQCRKTQHNQARKRRGGSASRRAATSAAQMIGRGFLEHSDPDKADADTIEGTVEEYQLHEWIFVEGGPEPFVIGGRPDSNAD
jgi:hypothetical protein